MEGKKKIGYMQVGGKERGRKGTRGEVGGERRGREGERGENERRKADSYEGKEREERSK